MDELHIDKPTDAALIFPGQGAQYVGMGKVLYENHEIARKTFECADEILGFPLSKMCLEGPEELLTETQNCQVAILVSSIAALRVYLTQESKLIPQVCLGLSLGEYTALVAAESILFSDAVKLVRRRGQYMQEAAEKNPGGMVSIIGLDREEAAQIAHDSGVEIANLNSPGQIVLSGKKESIKKAADIAKQKGAKKAIILNVSGAFHSSLMTEAGQRLA